MKANGFIQIHNQSDEKLQYGLLVTKMNAINQFSPEIGGFKSP